MFSPTAPLFNHSSVALAIILASTLALNVVKKQISRFNITDCSCRSPFFIFFHFITLDCISSNYTKKSSTSSRWMCWICWYCTGCRQSQLTSRCQRSEGDWDDQHRPKHGGERETTVKNIFICNAEKFIFKIVVNTNDFILYLWLF